MVTINQLADMIAAIAGIAINKVHIPGPQGVRGRNSDNRLISEKLGWRPSRPLKEGLEKTYIWIAEQVGWVIQSPLHIDLGHLNFQTGTASMPPTNRGLGRFAWFREKD